MISVIIPTRNRPELLKNLVNLLLSFDLGPLEIIVVDSSDASKQISDFRNNPNVKILFTTLKSAAMQRNIGLDYVENSDYVFFLDDDVVPSYTYFADCLMHLKRKELVGVSGVAWNAHAEQRTFPAGSIGFFQKIFLLDSKRDGILLKSGVNIPVRNLGGTSQIVEWLIGCSGWKANFIGSTRFEPDFLGQSLGEDVIFSIRMGKKGHLLTDPSIVLEHFESEIERPDKKEFWRMWVVNRKRLIEVAEFGLKGELAFWWANFGQLIILTYSKIRNSNSQRGAVYGFFIGCIEVLRGKN